jgi:hypothetical protein
MSEEEARALSELAPGGSLDDMTPSEMLAANVKQSLRRQAELLNLPFDIDNPQTNKLIADVANQTLSAGLRAQETALAKRDDPNRKLSNRVLERIAMVDEKFSQDERISEEEKKKYEESAARARAELAEREARGEVVVYTPASRRT